MLGKTLGRMLMVVAIVTVVAAVPICIWQRAHARNEIEMVSARFVEAASKLDLVALRECLTNEGRASLPDYYACVAARKMSELNRDVRVSMHIEVAEVNIVAGEATVRLRRSVTERGTRLGKPVNSRINDECIVICVYDGEQWLVDLDRTLKDARFPTANISLFKECVGK